MGLLPTGPARSLNKRSLSNVARAVRYGLLANQESPKRLSNCHRVANRTAAKCQPKIKPKDEGFRDEQNRRARRREEILERVDTSHQANINQSCERSRLSGHLRS